MRPDASVVFLFFVSQRKSGDLGRPRGCWLGGRGDVEPLPKSWSRCSPRTSTKCSVPSQGIPHSCLGMKPKPEGCQRSFWTCLLASHSSFSRVAVVRPFGCGLGLLRGPEVFLRTSLWLGWVGGVGWNPNYSPGLS